MSLPPEAAAFSLVASPTSVGSYDKINLTGTYAGHDGKTGETLIKTALALEHGTLPPSLLPARRKSPRRTCRLRQKLSRRKSSKAGVSRPNSNREVAMKI